MKTYAIVLGGGSGSRMGAEINKIFLPLRGIPTIVRAFKSAVTRQINLVRQTPAAAVWQRNYYEHIIRDEQSCEKIAAYILNNPLQWEADQLFKAG